MITRDIPSPDCPYMDYRCTRLLSVRLTSTRTTCIKRSKQLFTALKKNTCIREQRVESCEYIGDMWPNNMAVHSLILHVEMQSCFLFILLYRPIGLPTCRLSYEEPIRIYLNTVAVVVLWQSQRWLKWRKALKMGD